MELGSLNHPTAMGGLFAMIVVLLLAKIKGFNFS